MARRCGEPITVRTRGGYPCAFTWRGVTYRVRVIGSWRLATRWWERETGTAVDRIYFRVQAADFQVFEVYRELAGSADSTDGGSAARGIAGERWVLDVCQD